jgi:hypothetical protein
VANNTNSYTYKRYSRNKSLITLIRNIVLVLGITIGIYILFVLWLHPLNIFWMLTFGTLAIIFTKWVDFELRLNSKDRSWNFFTWGRGAGAELKVANQLEDLPDSFKVISNFYTGKGDIDYIIICPKGLFVIEVKAAKGSIEIRDGSLYVNNKIPPKNYLGQALAECLTLKDILNCKFNRNLFITGILEFPNAMISSNNPMRALNGIWVGGSKCHESVINQLNIYLDEQQVDDIYQYLLNLKQ